MVRAGLGTADDRTLELAIKGGALFQRSDQNAFTRCLACLRNAVQKPAAGDDRTVEERRSLASNRTSKWGPGGEKRLVLDQYHTRDAGESGTLEWRRYIEDEDSTHISYWHDLPLVANENALHAFIEIPRDTRAKFEMCPTEATNPIKQDEKKGKPRFYNIDIKWNYGALPQTWEQPEHEWKGLEGYAGDDDPVDVVDISSNTVPTGSVIRCKPLAALAMIDEGEVDWKVIVINVNDPLASKVNLLPSASFTPTPSHARMPSFSPCWQVAAPGAPPAARSTGALRTALRPSARGAGEPRLRAVPSSVHSATNPPRVCPLQLLARALDRPCAAARPRR